jgi:PAS domain S-box-containing protein
MRTGAVARLSIVQLPLSFLPYRIDNGEVPGLLLCYYGTGYGQSPPEISTPDRHQKGGCYPQELGCVNMPEHRISGVGGASRLIDAQNTGRIDDQEATNRSSERSSDLLTLSYEPMLAWRLDGAIEFWNAGAERLYGFAADDAVGRSSHSLLQTKFPIEFIEFVSQLRSERCWSGQLRHICKDGHEVIVDSRMQLFGDDTVLEVNRDVTEVKALIDEHKQIEHALRESEQQLRWLASVVESSDEVIISKNLGGIIISWN